MQKKKSMTSFEMENTTVRYPAVTEKNGIVYFNTRV
jgi:hypothetical protein